MSEEESFNIFKSRYVPEARIISEEEVQQLLEKYKITKQNLPKILSKDPVAKALGAKPGDVIEFLRRGGLVKFYRVVISSG